MRSRYKLLDLMGFLYTQNPFYLISACLVLYGLQVAFRPGPEEVVNPWAMMILLCGYTLLVAVTAFLVVRFGKVWEDARSLVLTLLLLFLAFSISFDEIVNTPGNDAARLLLFGFYFSSLISEGLIRGLRIRFPALYRIPYYLILGLFFAYPLCISPEVVEMSGEDVAWRILLFPVAAGVLFLTLIPAIRRGSAYVRTNGTPWQWPGFPWMVFGFLAFGVCVRCYVFSIWFDTYRGIETVFGPYFLIPFCFALLVLLLEMGIVERRRGLQTLVMLAAPALLLMAVPTPVGIRGLSKTLVLVTDTLGSPLFLTVWGLAAFYAYAGLRKIRHAIPGLAAMLLLASFVGRGTLDVDTISGPQAWPFWIIGSIELVRSVIQRHSVRCFVAALCLIAALSITLWEAGELVYLRVVPYHLALASVLLVGGLFRDRFAAVLRIAGAVLFSVTCLAALSSYDEILMSDASRFSYVAALTLLCFGYWYMTRESWLFYAGLVNVGSSLVGATFSTYDLLQRTTIPRGYTALAWGIVCFVVAALISAMKGGLAQRLQTRMSPIETMPRDNDSG